MKKIVALLVFVSALSFANEANVVNADAGLVQVNIYPNPTPTYVYPRPVYPVPVYPVPVYPTPVYPVYPVVPVAPQPVCYTAAVPVQAWRQVWTLLQGWVWKLETTWQYQVVCR